LVLQEHRYAHYHILQSFNKSKPMVQYSAICLTLLISVVRIASFSINFDTCTTDLSDLEQTDELQCNFDIEPSGSAYSFQLFDNDCSSNKPNTVNLTGSSTNNNGDLITASIDLVKDELTSWAREMMIAESDTTLIFCVRANVLDGNGVSQATTSNTIEVQFDLDGIFDISSTIGKIVLTEDKLLSEHTVDDISKSYSVTAYQCDPETGVNYNGDIPPIGNGENLSICVETSNTDTKISNIHSFNLNQNLGPLTAPIETTPVREGVPNVLSKYDCSFNDGKKCLLETAMMSKFFRNDNMSLIGTGVANLDIVETNRRLQVDSSDGFLAAKFTLEVVFEQRVAVDSGIGSISQSFAFLVSTVFCFFSILSF